MKVKSKIGPFWIAALLFMAFCTVMMVRMVMHQRDIALDAIELLAVFCIDFLLLWATFDTWYAFQEDYLEIKSACFCHKKIHYFKIQSIEETEASYSSVALSNDRLDITFLNDQNQQEEILVSPVKKDEFIQLLKHHSKIL